MHIHHRTQLLLIVVAFVLVPLTARAQDVYYPAPGDAWEHRSPLEVGMDPATLAAAIDYAKAHESDAPRDLEQAHYQSFGREPFGEAVGPFKSRGEMTGIIVRNGYIVAEWGEPERVDMTFSVTKSFLSTTVGLAWDQGLIGDLSDPVSEYVAPVVPADPERSPQTGTDALVLFETEHNRKITWDHLLRQTSDWEGTLWGKPDWADRPQGEPETWLQSSTKTCGRELFTEWRALNARPCVTPPDNT